MAGSAEAAPEAGDCAAEDERLNHQRSSWEQDQIGNLSRRLVELVGAIGQPPRRADEVQGLAAAPVDVDLERVFDASTALAKPDILADYCYVFTHLSHMTHTVHIEVTDETLAALRRDPASYAAELRLAAAAKLYEVGRVSQEVAAEIAGLSRSAFLHALSQFEVSPFQDTPDSLRRELELE